MMIHDLDMARFLLGEEPVAVTAAASCLVDPAIGAAGDVDTAVVTLRTASGRLCQISNSRRATYGYDQRIEAHGATGLLRAGNVLPTTVEFADAAGLPYRPGAAVLPGTLRRRLSRRAGCVHRGGKWRRAGASGRRGWAARTAAGRRGRGSRRAPGARCAPRRCRMKIGLVTDGLADLSLDDLLRTAADLGVTMLEFGCGNWSPAPHLDLDKLLASGPRAPTSSPSRGARPRHQRAELLRQSTAVRPRRGKRIARLPARPSNWQPNSACGA